jgi:DNA modification methylase
MKLASKNPAVILERFSILKPNPLWSFSDVGRAETSKLSHSYHRYPAKFIPQLVDKFIEEYTNEGDLVCDPFGGCGTTLVESKTKGRKSLGFDINPVAKFITDTKIHAIEPSVLIQAREEFIHKYSSLQNRKSVRKHQDRIYYWFDKKIVTKLDLVYASIFCIKNKNARRFFLCAFSHILKNCSRWLMKSIKPTIHKEKTYPEPLSIYLRHLDSMIKKNESFYVSLRGSGRLRIPAEMKLWDATKTFPVKTSSVDLIVTSPPYVTSYEYADLHQLSLLWFGDDKKHFPSWERSVDQFLSFRKKFIGSSYKIKTERNFNSEIALKIIKKLELRDKNSAKNVANYFADMNLVFSEMHRILKPGKKACLIIGNTELKGVRILNAEVATEQMTRNGFRRVSIVKREISNKMITSWRDSDTGKFTNKENPGRMRVYQYEYVILMEK